MLRTLSALLVAGATFTPTGQAANYGAATQVMSPTVVATWYAQQDPDGSNHLQLVILWRGTIAWWRHPGGVRQDGNAHYTIQYGSVQLTVRYDPGNKTVSVNGRDFALRDDNVLFVDNVDAPGGPKFLRTSHIDPKMPGTFGQIGSLLASSPDMLEYMQCGARSGNPALNAELGPMCMTNLGRQ